MSNSTSTPNTGLSYKDAGVDIEAGDALVDRIKSVAKRTTRPEVMGGLGGFGALCKIPKGYEEPVLVSGTDGVGTKLRLALNLNRHDTIGQDLVAMCVNDLLVCGAEPLFFLDYYATGHLNVDVAANVVTGIGTGCELAGCALVGGETAEMPGMYEGEDYDLAGFCVGVVEQSKIIDGSKVKAGDVLIGVASSGAHSNGYSLLRKILDVKNVDLTQIVDGRPLADVAMEPTRIYVKPILQLLKEVDVHAMAHITGVKVVGGGRDNSISAVQESTHQRTIKREQMALANDVGVITHHAGLFGGAYKMHQVHKGPREVIVDYVGFCRQLAELFEHAVGETGGGQLKIHLRLVNLVLAYLYNARRRVVAQRQYRALHTVASATFAHLEDDLFDTAHGVGQVGFVEVQNTHISLP